MTNAELQARVEQLEVELGIAKKNEGTAWDTSNANYSNFKREEKLVNELGPRVARLEDRVDRLIDIIDNAVSKENKE